jgi:hypothetical protein
MSTPKPSIAVNDATVPPSSNSDSTAPAITPFSDHQSSLAIIKGQMAASAHESSLDEVLGLAKTVSIDIVTGVKNEVVNHTEKLEVFAALGAVGRVGTGTTLDETGVPTLLQNTLRVTIGVGLPTSYLMSPEIQTHSDSFSLSQDLKVLADPSSHTQDQVQAANQDLQNFGKVGADFASAAIGYFSTRFLEKKVDFFVTKGEGDAYRAQNSYLELRNSSQMDKYLKNYPARLAANPSLAGNEIGFLGPSHNYSAIKDALIKTGDPAVHSALITNPGLETTPQLAEIAMLPNIESRALAKAALNPNPVLSDAAKANAALNDADRLAAIDSYAQNVRTGLQQSLIGKHPFGEISFPQSNADLADPQKPIVIKWITNNFGDRTAAFGRVKKLAAQGNMSLVLDDGKNESTFLNGKKTNGLWGLVGEKFLQS